MTTPNISTKQVIATVATGGLAYLLFKKNQYVWAIVGVASLAAAYLTNEATETVEEAPTTSNFFGFGNSRARVVNQRNTNTGAIAHRPIRANVGGKQTWVLCQEAGSTPGDINRQYVGANQCNKYDKLVKILGETGS